MIYIYIFNDIYIMIYIISLYNYIYMIYIYIYYYIRIYIYIYIMIYIYIILGNYFRVYPRRFQIGCDNPCGLQATTSDRSCLPSWKFWPLLRISRHGLGLWVHETRHWIMVSWDSLVVGSVFNTLATQIWRDETCFEDVWVNFNVFCAGPPSFPPWFAFSTQSFQRSFVLPQCRRMILQNGRTPPSLGKIKGENGRITTKTDSAKIWQPSATVNKRSNRDASKWNLCPCPVDQLAWAGGDGFERFQSHHEIALTKEGRYTCIDK